MTAPEPLMLGQRVRFAATLRRTVQNAPREPGQWPNRRMKVWKRGDYLGELNPGEGVVVGLRTLYDGFVDWVDEVGYEFSPTQAHQAVLIATNVRHRPVLAFREDVEPVERRDDTAELVGVLQELRARFHAAGRRPEECYEMSLIDEALALVKGGER